MPEQTFRSPGFFEREIDLTQRQQAPLGTPAGIIGTAEKGPAFVPVTVGSIPDFKSKFGQMNSKRFGPYAVNEFLKHRSAVTYTRVLGAGANDTVTDIEVTRTQGTVKNAGFSLAASAGKDVWARDNGGTMFLAARHTPRANEAFGYPVFTDNDSFGLTDVNLIRAMIMVASGTRMMVLDGAQEVVPSISDHDDVATLAAAGEMDGMFKLVISSSTPNYATSDGLTAIRVLTASFNPTSDNYIGKILNTDPTKFNTEEHLLYADFGVEDELAPVSATTGSVMVLSGTTNTSSTSGDTSETFRDVYGRFDTRFQTPSTTDFISQPYGTKEYDLFSFESISDGKFANDKYKISIANVRKSVDPANEYGTFAVQVRSFNDTDLKPEILEQYPVCSLDPSSENYVAAVIGDMKAEFVFDTDREDERRVRVTGRFPNKSALVRIVINPDIEKRYIPATALPFGFRGQSLLNTNDMLVDTAADTSVSRRLTGVGIGALFGTSSIVPPVPHTFKVTKGITTTASSFVGQPGAAEIVDSRLYWGVKFTKVPATGSITDAILNPNVSSVINPLVKSYSKFLGISKLDALVTGSSADTFCNNKFSLAKVALSNTSVAAVTASAAEHMRETAYIRNGSPNPNDYRVVDSLAVNRVTLGTLVNLTSSAEFNKFSSFTKFTNFMAGGYDGVNILDVDASRLNDKASSSDTGGGANSAYTSPGLTTNIAGAGQENNTVFSYRAASRIMTDELTVNTNILAIPGIRDSFITDHAATRIKEYGLAIYLQDLVGYDENTTRLFDTDSTKPDVEKTSEQLDTRALDNNYVSAYFPDVVITDSVTSKKVKVPPSVAALGALAYNDKVGFPWFAPAGFNRGALDFVSNTDVRLNKGDRDRLQESNINPIANFPRQGTSPTFVIFGQKTMQQAKSALDRVNVRRMLLEVKRIVSDISRAGFVFEQNTPQTRARWVNQITPRLALVQMQAGIEKFKVVMNETNNTQDDIENNKLNGRIELVPTRTVEFVAIDFIITNAGVSFAE